MLSLHCAADRPRPAGVPAQPQPNPPPRTLMNGPRDPAMTAAHAVRSDLLKHASSRPAVAPGTPASQPAGRRRSALCMARMRGGPAPPAAARSAEPQRPEHHDAMSSHALLPPPAPNSIPPCAISWLSSVTTPLLSLT